jgi:hypothetical protein
MSQPSTAAEYDPTQDEFSIDNGDAGLLQVGREGATATDPATVYVMVNDQHEWTGSKEQAIEPDAYLFYGYTFPEEPADELPDVVTDTFCDDKAPVRLGYWANEHTVPYVALTATERHADWDGPTSVDPAKLAAELPADADKQIRAFAHEHGILGPDERIDPSSDWDESRTSALGWWLVAHYG